MGPNDHNPFEYVLSRPSKVGDQITLKGRLQIQPEYFVLNIIKDSNNIALHYKIIFSERKAILNTMTNGIWGVEEIYSHAAVDPGSIFTVKLTIQSDRTVVYFNDEYDVEYKHRSIPVSDFMKVQLWAGLNRIISSTQIYAKNDNN